MRLIQLRKETYSWDNSRSSKHIKLESTCISISSKLGALNLCRFGSKSNSTWQMYWWDFHVWYQIPNINNLKVRDFIWLMVSENCLADSKANMVKGLLALQCLETKHKGRFPVRHTLSKGWPTSNRALLPNSTLGNEHYRTDPQMGAAVHEATISPYIS